MTQFPKLNIENIDPVDYNLEKLCEGETKEEVIARTEQYCMEAKKLNQEISQDIKKLEDRGYVEKNKITLESLQKDIKAKREELSNIEKIHHDKYADLPVDDP